MLPGDEDTLMAVERLRRVELDRLLRTSASVPRGGWRRGAAGRLRRLAPLLDPPAAPHMEMRKKDQLRSKRLLRLA